MTSPWINLAAKPRPRRPTGEGVTFGRLGPAPSLPTWGLFDQASPRAG